MEANVSAQALSLFYFALLGLTLGLSYDLLRLPRYTLGAPLLWDGLFCMLAAAGCFVLAMEKGQLGVWDILAALAAFCVYINCISIHVFPKISLFSRLFSRIVRFLEKKYFFIQKILFKQK